MLRLVSLVLLIGLVSSLAIIQPTSSAPVQSQSLQMVKLQTQATSLGNGCYYPILIKLNLTWTGPTTFYTVQIPNFWLVITSRNNIIANNTDVSYKNPSNTIGQFNLFPNIPVNLILSFQKTCLASVNVAQLLYLDGTFNYTFALP